MKKRIISIFLVVSIIVSVFAISAVSTSAASMLTSPTITTASRSRDYQTITFKWKEVNGADRYAVYFNYSSQNTNSRYRIVTSNTSFTFNNVKASDEYHFQIRACDKNGREGFPTDDIKLVGAPVSTLGTVRNMTGFININWSAVSGAVKYYVWYRTAITKTWVSMGSTTSKYFNYKFPNDGTKYDLKVHAVFKNNTYTISNIKTITYKYTLPTPSYKTDYLYDKRYLHVYWSPVAGADKYEVARFYKGEKKIVYKGADTGFNEYFKRNNAVYVSSIIEGGPYYYQVRAYNSKGTSEWSQTYAVYHNPQPKQSTTYKIASLAYMQIDNKGNKYWNSMNGGVPNDWCAMYAGWLLKEAGGINPSSIGWSAGVGDWCDNLKRKGLFITKENYTPNKGDIVFFGSANWREHVGIVVDVQNENGKRYIYTSEGNIGSNYNNSVVAEKKYAANDAWIYGYGKVI